VPEKDEEQKKTAQDKERLKKLIKHKEINR
jgi:hypothetical protein